VNSSNFGFTNHDEEHNCHLKESSTDHNKTAEEQGTKYNFLLHSDKQCFQCIRRKMSELLHCPMEIFFAIFDVDSI
jgi:hypothetical protein